MPASSDSSSCSSAPRSPAEGPSCRRHPGVQRSCPSKGGRRDDGAGRVSPRPRRWHRDCVLPAMRRAAPCAVASGADVPVRPRRRPDRLVLPPVRHATRPHHTASVPRHGAVPSPAPRVPVRRIRCCLIRTWRRALRATADERARDRLVGAQRRVVLVDHLDRRACPRHRGPPPDQGTRSARPRPRDRRHRDQQPRAREPPHRLRRRDRVVLERLDLLDGAVGRWLARLPADSMRSRWFTPAREAGTSSRGRAGTRTARIARPPPPRRSRSPHPSARRVTGGIRGFRSGSP